MEELIRRRFSEHGDVARALELTHNSQAMRKTEDLATHHAQRAADSLGVLPPSAARDGLLGLCSQVLNRKS